MRNHLPGNTTDTDWTCSGRGAWYIRRHNLPDDYLVSSEKRKFTAASQPGTATEIDSFGRFCREGLTFCRVPKNTKIKITEIKDMGQNGELQKLEEFVEKLLSRSNLLRQQKAKLVTELAERDRLIVELRQSLAAQDSERSEVNDRLSKIVGQIEEWELDLGEEKAESATAESAEDFDEDPTGEDEDPAGEDEDAPPVKGQHNLFSVAGGKS
jgi:hypothetical protein